MCTLLFCVRPSLQDFSCLGCLERELGNFVDPTKSMSRSLNQLGQLEVGLFRDAACLRKCSPSVPLLNRSRSLSFSLADTFQFQKTNFFRFSPASKNMGLDNPVNPLLESDYQWISAPRNDENKTKHIGKQDIWAEIKLKEIMKSVLQKRKEER